MDDTDKGGALGVTARLPDGEADPVSAGADPPPAPSNAPGLVERFVPEDPGRSRYHVLQVALDRRKEGLAEGLVDQLRSEVAVVGATHDDEGKPDAPTRFSVVVGMDLDPGMVVEALAEPDDVAGVTAATVVLETEEPDAPTGADESDVSEALADVEAGEETADGAPRDTDVEPGDGEVPAGPEEPHGAQPDAAEESGAPAQGSGEDATAPAAEPGAADGEPASRTTEGEDATAGADDADEAVAAAGGESRGAESANHPAFEELKEDVEPVGYDSLVEELESTSLPGEFRDTADLEPVLSDAEEPERAAADDATGVDGDVEVPTVGDGGGQAAAPQPEAVVESLVAAVERDALTEDQRRALADALHEGAPKTLQVKLDHLQREVDELTAYKETLETFIDEYGSGDGLVEQVREAMQTFAADVERIGEAVEDLREDVARTDGRVDALDGRVTDTAEAVAGLREAVEARDEQVEDVAEEVAATAERLAETRKQVGTVDDRVDDVEGRVDLQASRLDDLAALEDRVDALGDLQERVSTLSAAVEELQGSVEGGAAAGEDVERRLAEVEDSLAEVDARLSALEADTGDRLDELGDRLDEVEQRLDAHDQWRERFRTLLSGAEPVDEPDGED